MAAPRDSTDLGKGSVWPLKKMIIWKFLPPPDQQKDKDKRQKTKDKRHLHDMTSPDKHKDNDDDK